MLYRRPEEHTKVSQAELDYIRSDGEQDTSTTKVNWFKLLSYRQTWTFALGKFLTDMIWWFYLSFLPDFFKQAGTFQLDLKQLSLPFIIIYIVSDAGSILFGWLSSKLISIGWTQNAARKVTMLLCALCVVPVFFASITESLTIAVALIALAAAAHQGWSANLYSIATDMFPKKAVSSVIGIGGMFGALGGTALTSILGE